MYDLRISYLFVDRAEVFLLAKTTFNATLVYTCLISVPFNGAVASKFLSYIKDSVQFHSSIEYLKNPPAGYQQPAYDLLANLDRIQGHIDTNQFANQYEFEAELQSVIYAAHDDHLSLTAGILGVFSFGTRFRIAAVSKDGIELPKVYLTCKHSTCTLHGLWKLNRKSGSHPLSRWILRALANRQA